MKKTKVCRRHRLNFSSEPESRPATDFGPNTQSPDGLRYECKRCFAADAHVRRRLKAEAARRADPAHKVQLSKAQDEIKRLQSELREMTKLAVSGDAIREMLGTLNSPNVQTSPDWLRGAQRQQSVHGTALMFLSDVHFDEVVARNQVNGCNEYNREIAVQRLKNTFRNAIVLCKGYLSRPKYDGAVVALGGDMVSGNIHDELAETNAATIMQTSLVLEEVLIEGIGEMADAFGKVHVPCVTGNHGRIHKKPRAKNRAFENYEWAIYQRVARYFKSDARITFDIPDGSDAMFSLYDKRYCLTHGDQFSGGNGIGGIMVPIRRGVAKKLERQQAIGDPFDVCMMGHWHAYHHMSGIIINGSVKGYDEYAAANNFGFEVPQQALAIVHPKHGQTFRMPILCDKAA
jgi:hypothetical protein